MVNYIGLRTAAKKLVAGATPTLLAMIVGEHNRVFLKTWTVTMTDPDTGTAGPVQVHEVVDEYVFWNNQAWVFTSLIATFSKRKQPLYQWINAPGSSTWYEPVSGHIWPPAGSTFEQKPKVEAAVQVFVNTGLTAEAQAWLTSVPEHTTVDATEQLKIPHVEGTVPLARYTGKLPSGPVTILEYVKFILRIDGNHYVFLGLHIPGDGKTDYTWKPGTLGTISDTAKGLVDLSHGESLVIQPAWLTGIAPKTPPGFVHTPTPAVPPVMPPPPTPPGK